MFIMQWCALPLFAAVAATAEYLANTGCDSELASQSVHMIQARTKKLPTGPTTSRLHAKVVPARTTNLPTRPTTSTSENRLEVSNELNSSWQGIRIVGAGLSRTGTQSLAAALKVLGFTSSHGEDFKIEPAKIQAVALARAGQPASMFEVLTSQMVDAVFDQPLNEFAELFQQRFNSKVVLSVHPGGADGWVQSILEFVHMWQIGSEYRVLPAWQPVPGCVVATGPNVSFPDELVSACKAAYESYNAKIIRSVPADKLLIYRVSQGWGPLCGFLGVAAPTIFGQPFPMPHVDRTKTVYQQFCKCGLACPGMKVNGHSPGPGDENLVPKEAHDHCSKSSAR